ncbi:dynein, axonemal, intermediate chain 1, paralog 2 [Neosynchiropus ocellatus]
MALPNKKFAAAGRKKAPESKTQKAVSLKKDEDDSAERTDGWKITKLTDPLEMKEKEQKEEITRILTTKNPHAPDNIVHYSFKEGAFKPVTVDHMAVHFVMEGNLVDKNWESEAQRRTFLPEENGSTDEEDDEEKAKTPATPDDGDEAEEGVEEERPDSVDSKSVKGPKLKITLIERATQVQHYPLRDKSCQKEPPLFCNFSATANQWEIHDAYTEELQKLEKSKQRAVSGAKDGDSTAKKGNDISRVARVAKIVERMLHQNMFDDIAQDFKYFEDASDEFRGQEGTLLPLWKFHYSKVKRLSVTALCWNKKYQDLFGVGMGPVDDFSTQQNGMMVFYTLKNSTFPEYIYPTRSSVLCLDIHAQQSHLVVVGLYDGCVAVYNLRKKGLEPVYESTAETGKHTDPVWQVRWQDDDMAHNPNFCSLSADGRVVSWTLVKNELVHRDIILLSANGAFAKGPEEAQQLSQVCGTSFDFHKQAQYLYLVGTEEGKIHKCSKMYSSQFLETYNAHSMPVEAVKWNYFHPEIFISCSSDWTVKIWDHSIISPMFTFDLGTAVSDVAWAPYSSTVFAAVTIDGKVHVFDLNVNKYEPICQQQVVAKRTKLTRVDFNPIEPILIVGDDRSYVTSLKLSPNLRKATKGEKGQELPKGPEAEVAKLEKLLSSLRDHSSKATEW